MKSFDAFEKENGKGEIISNIKLNLLKLSFLDEILNVAIAIKLYDIRYDDNWIKKILQYLVDVGKLKADFKYCLADDLFIEYSEFVDLFANKSEDCNLGK